MSSFVIKIGLSPLRVATFEHFFDFGALICVRFEHPWAPFRIWGNIWTFVISYFEQKSFYKTFALFTQSSDGKTRGLVLQ